MNQDKEVELAGQDTITDPLTQLLREGAAQLIYQAVEAELLVLLDEHKGLRTADGKAGVVRNGHLPARKLQTGLGPVNVEIPKVRSRTGEAVTFRSALVPPYVRKTRSLEAALPWLYLKGVSSGEMDEALKVLVGPEAKCLSASPVPHLKQIWGQGYRSWRDGFLDKDRWVYVWADGVYSGLRGEQMKLCTLVVIGVNGRGEKHFLTIEDGMRESIFGTIRHRTGRSKGCLTRDGMLHMRLKLGQCAKKKWKRLRGFDYLTKVIAGVKFKDGVEVTEVNLVAA